MQTCQDSKPIQISLWHGPHRQPAVLVWILPIWVLIECVVARSGLCSLPAINWGLLVCCWAVPKRTCRQPAGTSYCDITPLLIEFYALPVAAHIQTSSLMLSPERICSFLLEQSCWSLDHPLSSSAQLPATWFSYRCWSNHQTCQTCGSTRFCQSALEDTDLIPVSLSTPSP